MIKSFPQDMMYRAHTWVMSEVQYGPELISKLLLLCELFPGNGALSIFQQVLVHKVQNRNCLPVLALALRVQGKGKGVKGVYGGCGVHHQALQDRKEMVCEIANKLCILRDVEAGSALRITHVSSRVTSRIRYGLRSKLTAKAGSEERF